MIPVKSEKELQLMRASGRILAEVMEILRLKVKPGITTQELDTFARELINERGALAAFKDYKGFPASLCTSVNEEIVHGIPGPRILKEGDIVSLDLGVNYQGYFSDLAITVGLEKTSPQARKLMEVTRKALECGIKEASPGNKLSDISYAIQRHVENNGFSVVREFVGHGIGRSLHEEPEVPNFGRPNLGPELQAGMVLAIEPMVNAGGWESEVLDNGWTAVTKDRSLSAHFEHTVAVTDEGPQILTK